MKRHEIVFYTLAGAAVIGALVITAVNVTKTPADEAGYIIAQVLLTLALVVITWFYAIRTSDIAKATKEQAETSMKMAEEIRRPCILLRLDVKKGDTLELRTKFPPEEFKILATNAGSGPAINLEAYYWNKQYKSPYTTKGYLTQNEQWKASIMLEMDLKISNTISDEVQRELIDKNITDAIIVDYEDIYNRKFSSYLAIEVASKKWVFDGIQNIKEHKK